MNPSDQKNASKLFTRDVFVGVVDKLKVIDIEYTGLELQLKGIEILLKEDEGVADESKQTLTAPLKGKLDALKKRIEISQEVLGQVDKELEAVLAADDALAISRINILDDVLGVNEARLNKIDEISQSKNIEELREKLALYSTWLKSKLDGLIEKYQRRTGRLFEESSKIRKSGKTTVDIDGIFNALNIYDKKVGEIEKEYTEVKKKFDFMQNERETTSDEINKLKLSVSVLINTRFQIISATNPKHYSRAA